MQSRRISDRHIGGSAYGQENPATTVMPADAVSRRTVTAVLGLQPPQAHSDAGMTTLEWLLVTAPMAVMVGAAVVVQAIVRDIGIDAGRHQARFRTAATRAGATGG